MSATAITRTKSKTKTKGKHATNGKTKANAKDGTANSRRSKTGTSAKQKAANKKNAQKSTGPRTAAGKGKSRFNAVTHGLTARSTILPGENPAELAARQQHLIDTFQPCHPVELEIVERMAGDIWRADRYERAAGLRLAERLRHEPMEKDGKELEQAIELGGRLFWKPAFPLPISTRFPVGKIDEPQCAESPSHPHHPARLRLKLEQTLPGCDWLIDRWNELLQRLYFNDIWLTSDSFHTVRLMGKHAIDMASNIDVVRVFLCGLTLLSAPRPGPEREAFDWQGALIKMLMTFDLENKKGIAASATEQCEPFARRLAELPLAKLAPRDEQHARSWLAALIEQEIKRIRDIRRYLQVVADADAAEAPGRLAFETGPEGDRQRRYGLSSERLVIKRFGDFLKTRTMIAAGTFDPDEFDWSSVPCPDLSVVSGPLSVDSGQGGAIEEVSVLAEGTRVAVDAVAQARCGASDVDGVEARSFAERKTVGDCERRVEPPDLVAAVEPCTVRHQALASSLDAAVGCDDDPFLRNEPILSVDSSKSDAEDPVSPTTETAKNHPVGEAADNPPQVTEKMATDNAPANLSKKLSHEQLRALRFARWKEQKLKDLRAAGKIDSVDSGWL